MWGAEGSSQAGGGQGRVGVRAEREVCRRGSLEGGLVGGFWRSTEEVTPSSEKLVKEQVRGL